MNLEQHLRACLVAPDPGAAFTARVMTRVERDRARPRHPFIVIGAVLVAGVAAAMLAWQLNAFRTQVAPAPGGIAMVPAPGASPVVAAVEVRQQDPVRTVPETAEVATDAADPSALRIVLMQAEHASQDVAAKPAIDAFHASLLQALRSQPGVAVEVAGAGAATDKPANRVTVFSPRYTILPSGRRLYKSGNGYGTLTDIAEAVGGPQQWPVEVLVKLAAPATWDDMNFMEQSFEAALSIDDAGAINGRYCNFNFSVAGAKPPASSGGAPALCSSIDGLAAWLVAMLRAQPASPVDTPQLIAQLSDAQSYEGTEILRKLVNRSLIEGVPLDAAAIRAIAAYISGSPNPAERRSNILPLLGVRQPGLVAPLLSTLQRDVDEKVRLEALAVLIADYGSDSRARAALEAASRQDASELVRMAAQRPLTGEAPWQAYVLTTLANRALSVDARLVPVQYDRQLQAYMRGARMEQSWLGSEPVTRQLVDIFQELLPQVRQSAAQAPVGLPPDLPAGLMERMAELGTSPGGAVVQFVPEARTPTGLVNVSGSARRDEAAMQSVLMLLSSTNPAAATELRLRILAETPPSPRWLIMNALNDLADKRDDPRVREALDDIAAGRSGPELRGMLESSMTLGSRPATFPEN